MTNRRALLAALLFPAACGGGTTEPVAEPASITLSSTTVGFSSLLATLDLVATVRDANGSPISGLTPIWSTNAASVATVSSAGRVTAAGNGSAQITASVGAVRSPAATVTVQQVAATLTLSPDTLRLAAAGDTMTIAATVRDAGGSVMSGVAKTFTTANSNIATVNASSGRVTATADGATTVTGVVAPGAGGLTRNVRIEVGGSLAPAYLVGGYVGTAYSDQIGPASGGGGGFTYTVTQLALPPGLSLHPTTAQITGTPTVSGVHFFEVTATNGVLTLSERYAITISTKVASAFNLWITYNGGAMPPANARTALSAAHARWEAVITGDAGPPETYPPSGLSGVCQLVTGSLLHSAFIEDVAILMALAPIDGVGSTLARAGPCGFGRQTLPAVITGQMQLDQVDAASASPTYLQDVIQHEIAHVLGIGTLWQGSTTGVGTPNPLYLGTNGKAEWVTLGGPSMGGPSDVPLEPDIAAHWNEGWFNAEIMTPTTEGPAIRLPISRLTIGTLIDLGWTAALTAADAYSLPACAGACPVGPAAAGAPEGAPFDDVVIERMLPLP